MRDQSQSIERGAAFLDARLATGKSPGVATHEDATTLIDGASIAPEAVRSHISLLSQWPVAMDDAALHGLAGDLVRAIEPNTEADSAAVLIQILVAFGVLVGRGPHVPVEGDQHHANLYTVLTGETSKGRKGTSWGRVRQVFEKVPGWPTQVSGLSSGEGLKWAVRDAMEGLNKKSGEIEIQDQGVTDKRLMVTESEFAQALRTASRSGNTLSATIREAWDIGRLATLTKNDPITATGAHIGIIAHITSDELRRELTMTDRANGFANRFLFVCVKRSKVLPFGGDTLSESDLGRFVARLQQAADTARLRARVQMNTEARAAWVRVYPALSAGSPGLFGAVTGRAEAQCLRLALTYALLDGADAIGEVHLLAALAVWEYCSASVRYIFGSALGDPVADDILVALTGAGSTGLTRTEIQNLFKRHQTSERIEMALGEIERLNLAHKEKVGGAGRSAERWVSNNAN